MIYVNYKPTKSTFQLDGIFEDDHELCCNFLYKGQKFSLMWSSLEIIGAFEYPDSSKAQQKLKGLSDLLDRMIADPKGMEDSNDRHSIWGYVDFDWHNS